MLIAAVAMIDSRKSALPDMTGVQPGGLGPGFYPFWAAAFIFVASGIVAYRARTRPFPAEGVFKDRQSVLSVITIIVPVVVAVSLIKWVGFYVMTGAYMGYSMVTLGKYRWHWALAVAILLPAAVYATFEIGFRVSLPKSVFSQVLHF